jgi:ribonuclease III
MIFGRRLQKALSDNDSAFYSSLKEILGFSPKSLTYYQRAFVHRSMNQKDEKGEPINYERLEFLGDAMIGVIISKYLFKEVPSGNEGYLTKMRSKIVSRNHLNELGKELGLEQYLQSKISKDQFGENLHGNLFEALVGAIYLDRGHDYCERFIYHRVIDPHVDIQQLEGKVMSYKSLMIEWCQKKKLSFSFEVFDDTAKEDKTHFGVRFIVDGKVVGKARETSKKRAEEKAANRAFYALQDLINTK